MHAIPRKHPRPWHHESEYGPGLRRPLDREQRARFRFLITAHHLAGNLTRAARDIGEALLKRLGVDGRCDPSHATLARDTGAAPCTVVRATARMRDLGLLRWTRRIIRAGWRVEQTSNQYHLVPTLENPEPRPKIQRVRTDKQSARETDSKNIFLGYDRPMDIADARTALARIAEARRARLFGTAKG